MHKVHLMDDFGVSLSRCGEQNPHVVSVHAPEQSPRNFKASFAHKRHRCLRCMRTIAKRGWPLNCAERPS